MDIGQHLEIKKENDWRGFINKLIHLWLINGVL
jgi:hypothetical protein